ncbi:hypothetical protein SeLEV6574_g06893 [Synchytrium endobioticum]|uniref:DBF4-type domain-containing protein n=1 Tax=Synchytrium endobioticum TaxID=286115 RepID=A0A507CK89_9FUNG|nr:hypothetical protein SeLEV6574_g06893 [Synchytrium endobioticum]
MMSRNSVPLQHLPTTPNLVRPSARPMGREMLHRNSALYASAASRESSSRTRTATDDTMPSLREATSTLTPANPTTTTRAPLPPPAAVEAAKLRNVAIPATGVKLISLPPSKPRCAAQVRDSQLKRYLAARQVTTPTRTKNSSKPLTSRTVSAPVTTVERFATQQWGENHGLSWSKSTTTSVRDTTKLTRPNSILRPSMSALANTTNNIVNDNHPASQIQKMETATASKPALRVAKENSTVEDENAVIGTSSRKPAFPPPAAQALVAASTNVTVKQQVIRNPIAQLRADNGTALKMPKALNDPSNIHPIVTPMDEKSYIPAWREKLQRTVFYFYDLNPAQHRRLQKTVEAHGARVEKFLCPRVTHVVQACMEVPLMSKNPDAKEGVPYKLPCPKIVEIDDGNGKRLKKVQPNPAEIIEHFKNLGKKVWHVTRLLDVIQFLAPSKKRPLEEILRDDFLYGPTTGRDETNSNFTPFHGEYLLVEDVTRVYKPIIIKEFAMKPSDRNPPWPKVYTPNQINRCAFNAPPPSWLPTVNESYLEDVQDNFAVRSRVMWNGERETHYEKRKLSWDAAKSIALSKGNASIPHDDIDELWRVASVEGRLVTEQVKIKRDDCDLLVARIRTHQDDECRKPAGKAFYHRAGYCENCYDKYEDFLEHISCPKHRKFATNDDNFGELDDLLDTVRRPVDAPAFADSSELSSDSRSIPSSADVTCGNESFGSWREGIFENEQEEAENELAAEKKTCTITEEQEETETDDDDDENDTAESNNNHDSNMSGSEYRFESGLPIDVAIFDGSDGCGSPNQDNDVDVDLFSPCKRRRIDDAEMDTRSTGQTISSALSSVQDDDESQSSVKSFNMFESFGIAMNAMLSRPIFNH